MRKLPVDDRMLDASETSQRGLAAGFWMTLALLMCGLTAFAHDAIAQDRASAASAMPVVVGDLRPMAPSNARSIGYTMAPAFRGTHLIGLNVTMAFQGDDDGETRLVLPTEWSGEAELWRELSAFTVKNGTMDSLKPEERLIRHSPNAPLEISYRVSSSLQNDPNITQGQASLYRPTIRPDWFSFLGDTVFAQINDDYDRSANFNLHGFPSNWKLASNLQHPDLRVSDVLESTALGGEHVRVFEPSLGKSNLRVAIRGDFAIGDAAIVDMLQKIADTQLSFWDETRDNYVVTIIALTGDVSAQAISGTGGDDMLALWATPNTTISGMVRLLAHEYFHSWMPLRVGELAIGDDQRLDYWISEGFTDFYTFRTLLKSGLWTLDDFLAAWNQVLASHSTSPVRNAPNSLIRNDFWQTEVARNLAYQRGAILAADFDMRVRAATGGTKSLDTVVRAMKRPSRANLPPIRANLITNAQQHGRIDIADAIKTVVEEGGDALFPTQGWGQCLTISTKQIHRFEIGYDESQTQSNGGVISGVDANSMAYAAGMRDGMTLGAWRSGTFGDPETAMVYEVMDQGSSREMRWFPKSKALFSAQTLGLGLELLPGAPAAARASCLELLTGK